MKGKKHTIEIRKYNYTRGEKCCIPVPIVVPPDSEPNDVPFVPPWPMYYKSMKLLANFWKLNFTDFSLSQIKGTFE